MSDRSHQTTAPPQKLAENLADIKPTNRKSQSSARSARSRIQDLFNELKRDSALPPGEFDRPHSNPAGKLSQGVGTHQIEAISEEIELTSPGESTQEPCESTSTQQPAPAPGEFSGEGHIAAEQIASQLASSSPTDPIGQLAPSASSTNKPVAFTFADKPDVGIRFNDFTAGVITTEHQEQVIPASELSSVINLSPYILESLNQGHPIIANGDIDRPSMLAFGRRLAPAGLFDSQTKENLPALLLEMLDEDPRRAWSEDELLLVEQVTDQLTLALENACLFEEARLRAEQLAKLNEIGLGFTSTLDLKPLLSLIMESAVEIINCEAGSLFLVDDKTNELVFEVVVGPVASNLVGSRLEPGSGLAGQAIHTGKAIIANDVNLSQDWSSLADIQTGFMTKCLMVVPMRIKNRAVGAIEVINKTNGTSFSQADQELLSAFTTQATIAIENARLYTNELRRRQIADSLSGIARTISSAVNVDQIAEQTLDQLAGLIDYRFACIQLINDEPIEPMLSERLSLIAARPAISAMVNGSILPEVLTHQILKAKTIRLLPDTKLEPDADELFQNGFRSCIAATLLAGDEVVGLLSVGHDLAQAFHTEDVELIRPVCAQIAVAIQNARLFEQTQKARDALQLSVRYQKSIAQAVATLTDRGISALTEVLEHLGQASQASRAYYIETQVDGRGPYWRLIAEWRAPGVASQLSNPTLRHLPINSVNSWIERLRGQGFNYVNAASATDLESEYFNSCGTHTALQFAVSGRLGIAGGSAADIPGCIGFDQIDTERIWTAEEIAALQTAASALSNTIAREDLFSQIQINLAETEAQYQASARLNAADSFAEILNVLRQHTVIGNANASFVSLNLFDSTGLQGNPNRQGRPGRLIPIAHWTARTLDYSTNKSHIQSSEDSPDPISQGQLIETFDALEQLLHPERSTIVYDVSTDPRIDEQTRAVYIDRMNARSLLYVPLNVSGKWIGHISAAYRHTTGFTEQELRRLTSLAGQAAVAVEGLRLVEETRQRNEELATINQITAAVSRTLDPSEVLSEILIRVLSAIDYESGLVSLVDSRTQQLSLAVNQNLPAGMINRLTTEGLSGTPCEMVYRSGQTIYQPDLTALPDELQVQNIDITELVSSLHRPLNFGFHSYVGVPLISKGTTLGTICLFNQQVKRIGQTRLSLLTAVGQQLGVVVENARAYALAQKAVEEISEADRLKTQFLANMSHELRTPLNSIIGFSRVILKGIDGPITEQQTQDLNAIYNSGQHLLGLINDVLDLSKIEAGKMEIALEENVSLADIIQSVMSTMVGLVKDKPIELRQNLSPDLPLLTLDPMKIRQVLINLLSNSAKFTEQGSITVEAEPITSLSGQAQVIVRVRDTGPGIALADQAKLFQPFSQVDGSLTRKTGGSGLGLSICQHLVRMHCGEITLESEVGQGSIFSFTLPITPTKDQAPTLPVSMSNPEQFLLDPDKTPTATRNKNQKVILAIDKDPKLTETYRRYLIDQNYTIIASTELDQAISMAREIQPFAITIDVSMQTQTSHGTTADTTAPAQAAAEPATDGWKVLEALKTAPETRSIPVIVCTIITEQDQAMRLGAEAYLLKPILQEDLIRALEQLQQ